MSLRRQRRGPQFGRKTNEEKPLADVTFRSRLITSSVLSGLAIAATALTVLPAAAPDQEPTTTQSQEDVVEVDAIVVTGSRIARQDYSANSPIVTVTQEDFRATGSVLSV